MVLDKIALEICFELNNDPKNFKLTDTNNTIFFFPEKLFFYQQK